MVNCYFLAPHRSPYQIQDQFETYIKLNLDKVSSKNSLLVVAVGAFYEKLNNWCINDYISVRGNWAHFIEFWTSLIDWLTNSNLK